MFEVPSGLQSAATGLHRACAIFLVIEEGKELKKCSDTAVNKTFNLETRLSMFQNLFSTELKASAFSLIEH